MLAAREQRLQRDITMCNRGVALAEQTLRDAESALRLSLSSKDRAAEAVAREAVAVSRANYNDYRELCANLDQDLQRARKSLTLAQRLLARAPGQPIGAAVIEQRGQVERSNPAGGWAPLAADSATPLRSGDRLRTGPGSGAEFMLQDGATAAQIAADTEVQLTLDDLGNAVVDISRGAFYAAVTPLLTRMKRVEVRTPAAVLAVRGTRFAVRQAPDGSTELLVLEGVVEATPTDGDSAVMVAAGQRLFTRQGEPLTAAAAIDWNTTRRWWREEGAE
ncbi:FecR family protein [Sulfurivermis fontis]|uniref:FecR family protein n=1 Tax=Sulfurivermis fontis TaxID=1972068 RepID=UPI0015594B6B|nr:FecR family protein [Sulfurivermis fontis]